MKSSLLPAPDMGSAAASSTFGGWSFYHSHQKHLGGGPGLTPLWSPTASPEEVAKEAQSLASASYFIGVRTSQRPEKL